MFKRIIVIVLDGVGVGASPDAIDYGDEGANSLAHCALAVGGLRLPHMGALGLGTLTHIAGVAREPSIPSRYGKLQPLSPGKDSVSGHWELMGVRIPKPLPTYPHGFPADLIRSVSEAVGRDVIGNKAASGTEIIQELGDEHVKTGKLIVYTSADSVFQIAAHEEVVPVLELMKICETVRGILHGQHAVGRVIARPFLGNTREGFFRTQNRRDFPLPPPGTTVMDLLVRERRDVVTVGKIDDIFAGRGITRAHHTGNNQDSMTMLLQCLREPLHGLLFVNFIEFDMVFGHRRDPKGYARALEDFDRRLPEIMRCMGAEDLLMIVADHGVDPTFSGTDHTREFVPLLVFSHSLSRSVALGLREGLGDIAATIAESFRLDGSAFGRSFLAELAPRARICREC